MVSTLWLSLQLLLLIGLANWAPIVAKRLLGERCAVPVDFGCTFVDGRPLLGPAKTWRGLAAAQLMAVAAALGLGHSVTIGLLVGGGAMAGDLLSSFVKRRLGVPSSGKATGLDQIPEALLPLLAVQDLLQLPWAVVLGVTLAFLALGQPISRWSHRHGLRDRPY